MTTVATPSSAPVHVRTEATIPEDHIAHPHLRFAILKGTPIFTAAAIATGCAYVALNNPETKNIFPVCGFYAATGLYCPGCGMTRALHSVIHGDIIRAFQFNALLVVVLPILMYFYVWWMTWAFTGRELPSLKVSRRVTWALVGLLALFIVGRNFPGSVAGFFARGRV